MSMSCDTRINVSINFWSTIWQEKNPLF